MSPEEAVAIRAGAEALLLFAPAAAAKGIKKGSKAAKKQDESTTNIYEDPPLEGEYFAADPKPSAGGGGGVTVDSYAVRGRVAGEARERLTQQPLEGEPLALDDPKLVAMEAYVTYERRGVALDPGKH